MPETAPAADTTLFASVPMAGAIRHVTLGRTQENLVEIPLGRDFKKLLARASDRGMRINAGKTQLLVISPNNGCHTAAFFTGPDGQVIASVESLKSLWDLRWARFPAPEPMLSPLRNVTAGRNGCSTTSGTQASREQASSASTAAM